ncbi:hypothetical protein ACFSZS_09030 [Seohaeicola zhoushanensis]
MTPLAGDQPEITRAGTHSALIPLSTIDRPCRATLGGPEQHMGRGRVQIFLFKSRIDNIFATLARRAVPAEQGCPDGKLSAAL